MCYTIFKLYLHCSHLTIGSVYCGNNNHPVASNLFLTRLTVATYGGNPLAEHCPYKTPPQAHSYFVCCPACRGRVEHVVFSISRGGLTVQAFDPKRVCSRDESKDTTLPTCQRFQLRGQMNLVTPNIDLLDTFPAAANRGMARFALSACHHMIEVEFPAVYTNTTGDSVFNCGCWTGKAPDRQTAFSALSTESAGAHQVFKNVWDITCQRMGCWECGGSDVRGREVLLPNDCVHGNGTYLTDQEVFQKNSNELSYVQLKSGLVSREQRFLQACGRFENMENWKDIRYDGDIDERGPQLQMDSRF